MDFTSVGNGNLYLIDLPQGPKVHTCFIARSSMGWLWHRRLRHVSLRNLEKLIKGEHILGLKDVTFKKDRLCSACQARKQVGGTTTELLSSGGQKIATSDGQSPATGKLPLVIGY